jgi:hypothetical protein
MEFFGLLITMVPLVLLAFIFNWVHTLKINSYRQIQQNEEIISLLKELCKKE